MALSDDWGEFNRSFPQGMPAIQEMMANVRRAEQLGFDSIWSGDHLIMHSPIMDVMTVLASFAAITTRYPRYGGVSHAVAPSCGYRQAGDFLDLLSGGRFIFGVGVGGEIVREFDAVGVPVQERGRRTDEGLEILTRVFCEDNVTYEGKHYQIHHVTLAPRPQQQPYPPIWVGGRSEAALRRTARFGNCWLGYLVSSRRLQEALQHIHALAPTYGREPATIQGGMLLFTVIARIMKQESKWPLPISPGVITNHSIILSNAIVSLARQSNVWRSCRRSSMLACRTWC